MTNKITKEAFARPELIGFWQHMKQNLGEETFLTGKTSPGARKALESVGISAGLPGEPVKIHLSTVLNTLSDAFDREVTGDNVKSLADDVLKSITSMKGTSSKPNPTRMAKQSPAVQRQRVWQAAAEAAGDNEALKLWVDSHSKRYDELSPKELADNISYAFTAFRRIIASTEQIPLAVFAARTFGDPHFLDFDRVAGRMFLEILATIQGEPVHTVNFARVRRRLWKDFNILADDVSASIMIAGFRPSGRSTAAINARTHSDSGEVALLTVAEAVMYDIPWVPDEQKTVVVVENPTIIKEAVRRLGAHCPPMVCTQGNPDTGSVTSGTWDFLDVLHQQGAKLLFHADFDFQGVRLINSFLSHFDNAEAWLMSSADYEKALQGVDESTCPKVSRVLRSSWGDLSSTMNSRGLAAYEESCIEQIIAHLQVLAWVKPRTAIDRMLDRFL